jgi:hypothetical protein
MENDQLEINDINQYEAMSEELITIKLGDKVVIIDPDKLCFNEATLSTYMEKEAGYYSYFGAMLALAEKLSSEDEQAYEVIYWSRFVAIKDESGDSDKKVEGSTKSELAVQEAKKKCIESQYKVKLLQQHLRAWDKNHENSQSRGHFLRKEMDKLNRDIKSSDNYYEHRVEGIIKDDLNIDVEIDPNLLK